MSSRRSRPPPVCAAWGIGANRSPPVSSEPATDTTNAPFVPRPRYGSDVFKKPPRSYWFSADPSPFTGSPTSGSPVPRRSPVTGSFAYGSHLDPELFGYKSPTVQETLGRLNFARRRSDVSLDRLPGRLELPPMPNIRRRSSDVTLTVPGTVSDLFKSSGGGSGSPSTEIPRAVSRVI